MFTMTIQMSNIANERLECIVNVKHMYTDTAVAT